MAYFWEYVSQAKSLRRAYLMAESSLKYNPLRPLNWLAKKLPIYRTILKYA